MAHLCRSMCPMGNIRAPLTPPSAPDRFNANTVRLINLACCSGGWSNVAARSSLGARQVY